MLLYLEALLKTEKLQYPYIQTTYEPPLGNPDWLQLQQGDNDGIPRDDSICDWIGFSWDYGKYLEEDLWRIRSAFYYNSTCDFSNPYDSGIIPCDADYNVRKRRLQRGLWGLAIWSARTVEFAAYACKPNSTSDYSRLLEALKLLSGNPEKFLQNSLDKKTFEKRFEIFRTESRYSDRRRQDPEPYVHINASLSTFQPVVHPDTSQDWSSIFWIPNNTLTYSFFQNI